MALCKKFLDSFWIVKDAILKVFTKWLRTYSNCHLRKTQKFNEKNSRKFFEKFEEIEHINTKEELKALHEGIEDGTEPEKKEEKTELHEQK